MQPLLIEIGVEELPAIPLLKILDKIEKAWGEILERYRLQSSFRFDYTPRRLVLRHEAMPEKQSDETVELFGPPIDIAFKEGEPTQAALGFAKKCGVGLEDIGRAQKGGREMLYFKQEQKGEALEALIGTMIREWIAAMPFGKMMRWGDCSEEFIRPVRWLQVRYGDRVLPVTLFGVKSSDKSYLHRMVSFEPITIENIASYERQLQRGR